MPRVTTTGELTLGETNYGAVTIELSYYIGTDTHTSPGMPSLKVYGADTYVEELIAVATAYPGIIGPKAPYTLIKDYSENRGIFDFLIREGVIEASPAHNQESGFVTLLGAEVVHPYFRDAMHRRGVAIRRRTL